MSAPFALPRDAGRRPAVHCRRAVKVMGVPRRGRHAHGNWRAFTRWPILDQEVTRCVDLPI